MGAKGGGVKGESWRQQWDHRVDSQMRESIGDTRELGQASEKPSPAREEQHEMREKPESARRQKMWGGESGSRSL